MVRVFVYESHFGTAGIIDRWSDRGGTFIGEYREGSFPWPYGIVTLYLARRRDGIAIYPLTSRLPTISMREEITELFG